MESLREGRESGGAEHGLKLIRVHAKWFGTSDGILGERLVSADSIKDKHIHRQNSPAGSAEFRCPLHFVSAGPADPVCNPSSLFYRATEGEAKKFAWRR